MVALFSTAGVSDEVAQELQMPRGPQMLKVVDAPMPARPTTLRDPGTPDQIVMDQHSLTHFPSQPWWKVEDMIHHIENSRESTQLCLNFNSTMGTWVTEALCRSHASWWEQTPLLEPSTATMVPDSKKVDMPSVVAATAKWVRDLGYERFCLHGDTGGVLQLLLDKEAKECRPEGQDWQILRQVSPTHRAIRGMEQLRKQSPQCVDSREHIWQFSTTKSRLLK